MNDKRLTIDISFRTLVTIAAALLGFYLVYRLRAIILLIFLALIVTAALDPLVVTVKKRLRIPRLAALVGIYTLLISGIAFLVAILLNPLTTEFDQFISSLPSFFSKMSQFLEQVGGGSNFLSQGFSNSAQSFSREGIGLADGVINTAISVISGLAAVITVLVLSFYLLLEENGIKNALNSYLPVPWRKTAVHIATTISQKMGGWVRGQIVLCLAVGMSSYIGLLILGIPYALVLALFAGLMEVIPFIGPFLGLIPAFLVALTFSPAKAMAVIVLYFLVQQLENHVLVPQVMRRALGLHPAIVMISILIGGKLLGLAGVLLATPLAATMSVIINDFTKPKRTEP